MTEPSSLSRAARKLTDNDGFDGIMLVLVIANAMALGAEEIGSIEGYENAFAWFYSFSTLVFVLELVARFVAAGPRYRDFFKDIWNLLDTFVVVVALLPMVGSWGFVGRFARLARFLRLGRIITLSRRIVEPRS